MSQRARIEVGTRIWWDGEPWSVSGFHAGELELQNQQGKRARIRMSAITEAVDFKVLTNPSSGENGFLPNFLESVAPEELRRAEDRERHILEFVTGYTRGSPQLALEHEPRQQYDPELTTMRQRVKSKAEETGISVPSLWRYKHPARCARIGRHRSRN